jgi:hypothetical protein
MRWTWAFLKIIVVLGGGPLEYLQRFLQCVKHIILERILHTKGGMLRFKEMCLDVDKVWTCDGES